MKDTTFQFSLKGYQQWTYKSRPTKSKYNQTFYSLYLATHYRWLVKGEGMKTEKQWSEIEDICCHLSS